MSQQNQKKISARKLAILHLLDAADATGREPSPVEGTTKLQKLMFLVQVQHKNTLDPNVWDIDFDYVPEKFGPADLDLYQDLDFLESLGHIRTGKHQALSHDQLIDWVLGEESGTPSFPEEREEEELSFEYLMGPAADEAVQEQSGIEKIYQITAKGRAFLDRLESTVDPKQKSEILRIRDACRAVKREYGSWPLKRLLELVYRNYPSMITESTIRDRVLGKG